jgi:hypothetical protein
LIRPAPASHGRKGKKNSYGPPLFENETEKVARRDGKAVRVWEKMSSVKYKLYTTNLLIYKLKFNIFLNYILSIYLYAYIITIKV